jgi:uncharacterized membrane protein
VAGGNATRSGSGGGGSIQASSQIFARVGAALASLLGAAGVGASIALTAGANRLALGGLALAGVVLLAVGLARPFPSLLPWPVVILAGAYAWKLGDGGVDQWAPVYAGGLLAVAELAYWSIELRGRAQEAERLTERRAALIATLALASVAASGLVLAATSVRIGSGVATDLLGVAAAVAALAIVAALARPRA